MANATIRQLVLLLMPIIGDQPPSSLRLQLLSLAMENTVTWQKASCCGIPLVTLSYNLVLDWTRNHSVVGHVTRQLSIDGTGDLSVY